MNFFAKTALSLSLSIVLQALAPLAVRGQESALEPLWTPCCGELQARQGPVLLAIGDPAERGKKKALPRSRLVLTTALTLGAGALAYWSKQRANKAYDTYLKSANPERQQKQYDRARRFDHMAGAALLSMEVGVVFTSYLLFFRR